MSQKDRPKSRLRSGERFRLRPRLLASASALLLLGAGAAACSSSSSSQATATVKGCSGTAVNLTEEDYYGPAGSAPADFTGNAFQTFFANYSKAHPCDQIVRQAPVVGGSDSVYLTHVLSQFSSSTQPGLLMLDNPELAEFAANNLLVPLKSLGALPVVSQINPANIAETTYNGQLYALPLYTNTIAIFYNKTLVKQAGITAATWGSCSPGRPAPARPPGSSTPGRGPTAARCSIQTGRPRCRPSAT